MVPRLDHLSIVNYRSPNTDALAVELVAQTDFVRRMARALLQDQQVAEDVVQETMLAAIKHRPDPDAGLQVWLKSVLRRRVLLHFRNEQRRAAREYLSLRDAGADGTLAGNEGERAAESLARNTKLGKVIAALDDPYRTVITLRYYESLPPRVIAKRLGRPVTTVNTQIQRGLQKLRQRLDETNDGDRRAWVVMLLPHALHGRGGWWPASVGGVGGVAYGTIAQVALLFAGLVLGVRALMISGVEPERLERIGSLGESPPDVVPDSAAQAVNAEKAAPRSTLPVPSETEVADGSDAAGTLRVFLHGDGKPLAGARASAFQVSESEFKLIEVKGQVRGFGTSVAVLSSEIVVRQPPNLAGEERRSESATAGSDGFLELPILDGEPWVVYMSAEGFTPLDMAIEDRSAVMERSLELRPGGRVVIDRGGFPLDSQIVVEVKNPFGGMERQAVMGPGTQVGELSGVPLGPCRLEAMSLAGPEVGHWISTVDVQRDQATRVDLTAGGCTHTQVDVRGTEFAVPPQFAQVHGPMSDTGRLPWSQFAGVHDGLADFHGIPPGPAVVRILAQGSELARTSFTSESGAQTQLVKVQVPSGRIHVEHSGVDGKDFHWSLAVRSDTIGARGGWVRLGEPLWGKDASVFYGCEPGSYRIWLIRSADVRRFDFEFDGVALDLSASSDINGNEAALHPLQIERGAGLEFDANVEIQLAPGSWRSLETEDGRLHLSGGTHRLRCALEGTGFATIDVTVPEASSAVLAEAAPRQPIVLTCDAADPVRSVRVFPMATKDILKAVDYRRGVFVELGEDGSGSADLRPGRYVVNDQAGRSARLEVGAGVTAATIDF